jgi:deoxyribodipyrimidine photo-lyase
VRPELSDNYCYYNDDYDSIEGFPNWAKATLETHKNNTLGIIYTPRQFEKVETDDLL